MTKLVDARKCVDLLGRRVAELEAELAKMRQEVLQIVVTPNDTMKLLAVEDLQEILKSYHAEDYFIGGMVDRDNNMLVLYRGDFDRLLVPLDFFMKKDQAVKPDFADFDITDVGQTLRFGDYEAASSAVLYEFDAAARKRMRELEGLQTIDYLGPVCSPDEAARRLAWARTEHARMSGKKICPACDGEGTLK